MNNEYKGKSRKEGIIFVIHLKENHKIKGVNIKIIKNKNYKIIKIKIHPISWSF